MPQPLELDVENIPLTISLKMVYSMRGIVFINIIHVAKWNCKIALFKKAGKLLKKG